MIVRIEVRRRPRWSHGRADTVFKKELAKFVSSVITEACGHCIIREVVVKRDVKASEDKDWYVKIIGPGGSDIDERGLDRDWMEFIGHWVQIKKGVRPGRVQISFDIGMGTSSATY